jgi:hypothetical protein
VNLEFTKSELIGRLDVDITHLLADCGSGAGGFITQMKTVDFSRSFFTFRIDTRKQPPRTMTHAPVVPVNNARIQIDCRCRIQEKITKDVQEYYLGASCKGERVGVKQNVWTEPYCDFVPTFSQERFLLLKTFDTTNRRQHLFPPSLGVENEKHSGKVSEAFEHVRIHVIEIEGELIDTTDKAVESVLVNYPLVGLTEIDNERYIATLEYPIKTISASEVDKVFQTDTGPVLFPDLSRPPEDLIGGFELAFSSFNNSIVHDWVEFLVRAKTSVAEGVSVHHYCKPVRVKARNTLMRTGNHSG